MKPEIEKKVPTFAARLLAQKDKTLPMLGQWIYETAPAHAVLMQMKIADKPLEHQPRTQKRGRIPGYWHKRWPEYRRQMQLHDLPVAWIVGWFSVSVLLEVQEQEQGLSMILRFSRSFFEKENPVAAFRQLFMERGLRGQTAEQKGNSMDRDTGYLARLAHDLRAPLTNLSLLVQSLEERTPEIGPQLTQARRQLDILEQLTHDITSLESGRIPELSADLEMFTVRDLLQDMLDAFADHLSKKKIAVIWNAPEDSSVRMNQALLARIFNNILLNAIKFCSAPGKIHIDIKMDDHGLLVAVEDSGPGPRTSSETSFSLFRRNLGRSAGGWGLGLASAREQVERLGGSMTMGPGVRNSGSRFVVYLPNLNAVREF